MASRIVALSGAAGSGKSEVAKHLVAFHGYELIKFSSPLKDMLRTYYATQGLDPLSIERRIEGDLKEEPDIYLSGRTPRHAMETIGTEWGRDCMGDGFWLVAWLRRARAVPGPVVVDDCRFENEAQAVLDEGGDVILLQPKVRRRKVSHHAAEKGLPTRLVSRVIKNDGTIEDLNRKVLEYLYEH